MKSARTWLEQTRKFYRKSMNTIACRARSADKGFWIYDFALPVLTLHALYNHTGVYLKQWMERCPMHQFTTLDTHDGIGIVDVKDLLPDEEVER